MSGSTNKLLESIFKKISDDEQEEEIKNLSTLLRAVFVDKLDGESSKDYRLRSFSLLLNHLPRDSSYREDFLNKYMSDELKQEFIVAPNIFDDSDAKYITNEQNEVHNMTPPDYIYNASLQNCPRDEPARLHSTRTIDLEDYNRGIQNYPYSIDDPNVKNYSCLEYGWMSTRDFYLEGYNRGIGSIQNYPYSIDDPNLQKFACYQPAGVQSTRAFYLEDYPRDNAISLMAKRERRRCSIL